MIAPSDAPVRPVHWPKAARIIRSVFPPIDLFEDIAEPEDWPLLISAEQKSNPRVMETIGNLDLIPPDRRVGGPGATYLMAPFTHTSADRPSRFSDGRLGVLYIAEDFDTAVHETIHHHGRFMQATQEPPGWAAQFRELIFDLNVALPDIRALAGTAPLLDADDYTASQAFGGALRASGADGILYPSVRGEGGCAGLFYPDVAPAPMQGRHLGYHWDGQTVNLVRDMTTGTVYRVT